MKCDKFQPGCTNDAACMVRGCRLCVPCAQAFVGYTPDPIEEARQYLEHMSNFPGRNDSLDHLALVADVADALRADLAGAHARAERMQAAIERYLELDSDCEYVDGTPDVCPGIDIMGGPCQWCALRAALEDGR